MDHVKSIQWSPSNADANLEQESVHVLKAEKKFLYGPGASDIVSARQNSRTSAFQGL